MKIDGTRSNDRATEVVLAYYAAFNRGDWAAMLSLLGDEVVHELNHGPREIGKPAFAAFLQRTQGKHREQLHDLVVMASPDGARAAAEYVARGEQRGDEPGNDPGRPAAGYAQPGGAFFSIRDGRIQRVSNYHPRPDPIAPRG